MSDKETTDTTEELSPLVALAGDFETHAASMRVSVREAQAQLTHAHSCAEKCAEIANEIFNLSIEEDS